jgi:succinoglycan biosynthesis transport protein ExoP
MSLQQFLRSLRARWLLMLVTLLVTVGATITASLLVPKRYTATATVVVDSKGIDLLSGAIMPLLPIGGAMATQVDIIQSHSVARKAVDLLKLVDNPTAQSLFVEATEGKGSMRDWLADLLLRHLRVEPSRESSVINISYTGNDPRFAAAVANAIVQGYIHTNLELKIAPARQTNTFFNEQINSLKDNVERAQANLSAYQRDKGIVATDERIDIESNRLNELSTQLVAAQAQTYDSLSRQRQVEDFVAQGRVPDTLPDVLSNPVIQNLKAGLTQFETKLSDISSKLGKNHPSYQAVVAELDGVKRKLIDEMKTISATLGNSASLAQKREEQIKASLALQRSKVLEMKKVRDELATLVRETENAQRIYDGAMSRVSQTKLESQTTQTNVMVINEAIEPIEPSSPKFLLNSVFAIVIGVFLAVGLALLREMFDRVIRTEEELEVALGLPVLGVLAKDKHRWRGGAASGVMAATAEARWRTG